MTPNGPVALDLVLWTGLSMDLIISVFFLEAKKATDANSFQGMRWSA